MRDLYDPGGCLLVVATDRISAFDVVLPTPIPGKGRILTEISNFWFSQTSGIVPNHLLDVLLQTVVHDARVLEEIVGRAVVVVRAEPLKVVAIVRGYLAGSGWSAYQPVFEVATHLTWEWILVFAFSLTPVTLIEVFKLTKAALLARTRKKVV